MFEKLTETLDSYLTMQTPWYDCTVYHKGREVYRRTAGTLDTERRIPATGRERINVFSCSKLITVTAALMLYEKGEFDLLDRLAYYLPEYADMKVKRADGSVTAAKNPITVCDLFTMTAGLSYDLRSPAMQELRRDTNGLCPTRKVAEYLAREPLLYEPGEGWAYSLSHDVLAALVEGVSGMDYESYCRKYIFDPLGMDKTTFLLPIEKYGEVAPLYFHNAEERRNVACARMPVYRLGAAHASGGAGCVSSVDDYIRFLEALRTEKLLSAKTLDMMTTDRLTASNRHLFTMAPGYGYGLGVRCPLAGSDITDFGWDGAAGAHLAIDRKNEITLFYAQHVLSSVVHARRGELTRIVRDSCE